jgi:hypothetical protein
VAQLFNLQWLARTFGRSILLFTRGSCRGLFINQLFFEQSVSPISPPGRGFRLTSPGLTWRKGPWEKPSGSFCTSPNEVSLVLELSDARWLSEEMSFLAELYRCKADRSEREFGGDNNAALTEFLETQSKCVQLSVALQQALRRGFRRNDHAIHPINR